MFFTPQRPRPGRRRPLSSSILSFTIILFSIISFTTAYDISFEIGIYESIQFRELEERGEIHFDARPEPVIGLDRRQIGLDSSSSSSSSTTTTTSSSSSSASATPDATIASILIPSSSASSPSNTTTATSVASAPSTTVITTPLPSPFDTSLGNNFTSTTCPSFFTTFLSNSTFRSCTPISLLLQNSASFFRAQRSPSLLASTLDTACAAPLSVCTPLMTYLASELMSDANCGRDFRDQQPLVLQAYNGLVAYEPVYRATCLKDSSNNYCYGNAITNVSNPGDAYPYFTAIGLNLPVAAKPTCNDCLERTMQVFSEYAVRKEQPLSQTYLPCANQVDGGCGAGYANTAVKVGSVDSGMGEKAQALKSMGSRDASMCNWVVGVLAIVVGGFAML